MDFPVLHLPGQHSLYVDLLFDLSLQACLSNLNVRMM